MNKPVVGIVGWSGSGKTTLIEGLIAEFDRRGVRVAVIKHTHHGLLDVQSGTDTGRYLAAGSAVSVLATPQGIVAAQRMATDLATVLAALPETVDLVLVEGYKVVRIPKIEVVREGCFERRIAADDELIGLVTVGAVGDRILSEFSTDVPRWDVSDLGRIVDGIWRQFISHSDKASGESSGT